MKTDFGSDKLEKKSSKFVIEFFNYLSGKGLNSISIIDVKENIINELNIVTEITINTPLNNKFVVIVSHAVDMSCSNWQINKIN